MPEESKNQVTGNDITDSQRQLLDQMSGMEMAAVLMLSLNEEDAAQIFRHLEPKQVQRLGMSMASMSDFSHDRVAAVHRQFIDDIQKYTNIGIGSEDFVRKALVAALGEDKASNLVDQIILGSGARGLDSLKWMDARQVASIIQNEHPQIQTIVLSYLEPEQSAEILSQFPEQVRLDLVMRIANLEEVQPAALQELNDIMEKQFAGAAGAQAAKMGGLKAAANIMNYLDTNIEGQLMDSIRESDEEMSQQIQDLMFVFENLIDVDDRGIQTLLREVPGGSAAARPQGLRRSDAREDFQEHVETSGRNAGRRSGGHGANPGLRGGGCPEGDPLHRPPSGRCRRNHAGLRRWRGVPLDHDQLMEPVCQPSMRSWQGAARIDEQQAAWLCTA